jgi:isopropylmalate/homocitrate/citramalate synthase
MLIHTAWSEHEKNSISNSGLVLNALNEWIPEYMQRNEFGGTQPKVNIAAIEGGWPWRGARTPDTCSIYMDVRTPPEVLPMDAYREVRELIRALEKEHACLQGTTVDVYVSAPGTSIPDDHELIRTIVTAHTDQLGEPPQFGNEIWYSDAAHSTHRRHAGHHQGVHPVHPEHLRRRQLTATMSFEDDMKDNIWTSELNDREEVHGGFDRSKPVRFYDTTLRDGEQAVGIVFNPEEKFQIACALADLGVGRIEAGFPRVSEADSRAVKRIVEAGLSSEIWGFSRAVQADLDALLELGITQTLIEISTSDVKMKAYGFDREKVLQKVDGAVRHAVTNGMKVLFFAVDSTRSDLAFLRDVYGNALDAGASEIAVVDTIGACAPEAVESLVREVRGWIGPNIPLHFHCHNDFGLGTALAIAAVRGGADWIQGTINGIGERAGNSDLCEVALALQCLYDVPVELNLDKARQVSQLVQQAGNYKVDGWRPVVGDNLFTRESGAVANQFHIPEAIEPYAADIVSAPRRIVLGKKSGLVSIKLKVQELGLDRECE